VTSFAGNGTRPRSIGQYMTSEIAPHRRRLRLASHAVSVGVERETERLTRTVLLPMIQRRNRHAAPGGSDAVSYSPGAGGVE
jgi:hypothetical protein